MPEGPERARYFTLERGIGWSDQPRTVFCEWTAEGQHSNYGDGPPATVPEFAEAIEARLEADGPIKSTGPRE